VNVNIPTPSTRSVLAAFTAVLFAGSTVATAAPSTAEGINAPAYIEVTSGMSSPNLQIWIKNEDSQYSTDPSDAVVAAGQQVQLRIQGGIARDAPSFDDIVTVETTAEPHSVRQISLNFDTFENDSGSWTFDSGDFKVSVTKTSYVLFSHEDLNGTVQQVSVLLEVLKPQVRQTRDQPDIYRGFQIHPVYVVPADAPDTAVDTNGQISEWLNQGSQLLDRYVGDHWNIDTRLNGKYDVSYMNSTYTQSQLADPQNYANRLLRDEFINNQGLSYKSDAKNYVFFTEFRNEQDYCGYTFDYGNFTSSWVLLDPANCSTYTVLDYAASTWVHETLHTLGVRHVDPATEDDMMCGVPYDCSSLGGFAMDPKHVSYLDWVGKSINDSPDIHKLRVWSMNPGVPPGAPTIASIAPGLHQVSVAITPPTNNGGADISNYEYSIDGGLTWTEASPVQTTGPLVITGLTHGTTYWISVRAINLFGTGESSQISTINLRKISQAISFPQPKKLTVGKGDIKLSGSTSAKGLIISWTVAARTKSICSVIRGKLHAKKVGLCIVVAAQPGNAEYSPAKSVTRVVTIRKK